MNVLYTQSKCNLRIRFRFVNQALNSCTIAKIFLTSLISAFHSTPKASRRTPDLASYACALVEFLVEHKENG